VQLNSVNRSVQNLGNMLRLHKQLKCTSNSACMPVSQRRTGSVGPSSMKGVRPAPLRSTASLPRGDAPQATSSCCSGKSPAKIQHQAAGEGIKFSDIVPLAQQRSDT
jgi:hypothetical protein